MRQALIRPLYYPLVVLHLAVLVGALIEFATATSWPVVVVHLIMRVALLYAAGFVIYTLVRVSWSSDSARHIWLRVPIIGSSLKAAYAYRWITALRLEFGAGISLYRAVGDAWRASGYVGCERFAKEGEQAMLQGTDLSKLVLQWKQLPRDWIDFIETGEISGSLETAFKNLEAESARNWTLAQERMSEWVPKIVYFVILLIVAVQVGMLMYHVVVAPIANVENAIDNATK
jgi:type II secretory pathway component PulF